jgi:hypothetical protein
VRAPESRSHGGLEFASSQESGPRLLPRLPRPPSSRLARRPASSKLPPRLMGPAQLRSIRGWAISVQYGIVEVHGCSRSLASSQQLEGSDASCCNGSDGTVARRDSFKSQRPAARLSDVCLHRYSAPGVSFLRALPCPYQFVRSGLSWWLGDGLDCSHADAQLSAPATCDRA